MNPRDVLVFLAEGMLRQSGPPGGRLSRDELLALLALAWCQGAATMRFAPAWAEAVRQGVREGGAWGDAELVAALVRQYPLDPVALAHAEGLLAREEP